MIRHINTNYLIQSIIILSQVVIILIYLNANTVNVGEMGTDLSLLAAYFGLSGLFITFLCIQKKFIFRVHFFIFLLLLGWIVIRVWIDLGVVEEIKSITIGTTGGILTFYLAGGF